MRLYPRFFILCLLVFALESFWSGSVLGHAKLQIRIDRNKAQIGTLNFQAVLIKKVARQTNVCIVGGKMLKGISKLFFVGVLDCYFISLIMNTIEFSLRKRQEPIQKMF